MTSDDITHPKKKQVPGHAATELSGRRFPAPP
jgi:hypothetical protein